DMAPDRQDRVADELVDRAAPGKDVVHHKREVFIELNNELMRVHLFGHSSEPAQVGDDQRDLFAFAAQFAEVTLRVIEHFADNILRNVGLERAPDPEFFEGLVGEIVDKGNEAGDRERQDSGNGYHYFAGVVMDEINRVEITQSDEQERADAEPSFGDESGQQPRRDHRQPDNEVGRVQRKLLKEFLMEKRIRRVEMNFGSRHQSERRL